MELVRAHHSFIKCIGSSTIALGLFLYSFEKGGDGLSLACCNGAVGTLMRPVMGVYRVYL